MRNGYHLRAFTLIELLIVIAIIVVLAALLFPVFARARQASKQATALSNVRQIGLQIRLYSDDMDGMAPVYFSGFDVATGTYNPPQKYWPELVGFYGKQKEGRGRFGQAIADDLPPIFFDPGRSFKSQIGDDQCPYGDITSWGISDTIVNWFAPDGVKPSKLPISLDTIASPSSTLMLVETYDFLCNENYPGNSIALSYYDRAGNGAVISTDAPYGSSYTKTHSAQPADPNGRNVTAFADLHAKATTVSQITSSNALWDVTDQQVP